MASDPLSHIDGADRELFYNFLLLIRDNYKLADKASFFLESKAGVINTCGITNLRDVLSHLASFLDPATPKDRVAAQVASAEEHLRRAILEPYEIALATSTESFMELYDQYKARVIPVKDRYPQLHDSPNHVSIEASLAEIQRLAFRAKRAKSRNFWDSEWDDGVSALPEAYNKLQDLKDTVASKLAKLDAIENDYGRRSYWLTIWGTIATVLLTLAGIYIAYLSMPSRQP